MPMLRKTTPLVLTSLVKHYELRLTAVLTSRAGSSDMAVGHRMGGEHRCGGGVLEYAGVWHSIFTMIRWSERKIV